MAEEIQEDPRLPAPGLKLKSCREARHLSIDEVADKLHLRPSVIADLESDVIDHSISMTFTRGYIRLYARFLDLAPEPLLAEFDELANPGKQPAKLQSFSQKVAHQASDARLMMFSYFILFIIIAMAVVWWFQQPGSSDVQVSDTATELETAQPVSAESVAPGVTEKERFNERDLTPNTSEPELPEEQPEISGATTFDTTQSDMTEASPGEDVETGEDTGAAGAAPAETQDDSFATVTANNPMTTAVPDTSNDVMTTAPEASPAPVVDGLSGQNSDDINQTDEGVDSAAGAEESAVLTMSGTEVELVFTFTEDCWMNLVDATGEAIAYGIKSAGRVMPVSGIPPFEVKLGAPQAVTLTVDGEPYDMSSFPAGRTATFTIGESSS